jgi:5-(carboxyamino)imidazole ribonucleotide synthase
MTIGVLGGGQLGRMLALAGVPLGQRFLFADPSRESCAAHVGELLIGPYDEEKTLSELARRSEVVTFEFENVDLAAANYLAELVPVFPPPLALHISQERLREKEFFSAHGVKTPAYHAVDSRDALSEAAEKLGFPFVLKTRRFGYDGKGQFRVRTASELDDAWGALGKGALIAEAFVRFTREVSIIGARSRSGEVAIYPLFENHHEDGVLRTTLARARDPLQHKADAILRTLLSALNYVGVLTVELFEVDGELLANEMAPRVHNSGHLTIEASTCSQFENHVRAILDLPLGSTATVPFAGVVNILGPHPALPTLLRVPNTHTHLYGKKATPGRKCGHVTIVEQSEPALLARMQEVRALLS